MEILIFLVIWLAFGVIGAMIMSGRGRSGCGGFALGVLLGPIGLIIALLIRPSVQNEAERQMEIDALRRRDYPLSESAAEQPSSASGPNVFVRERPIGAGSVHYRWECDSCGNVGKWSVSEASAESQAEAHVCERRIPRRR